jgi:ferredoxin-nitrite reductase
MLKFATMTQTLPFDTINGEKLSAEQRSYLEGVFAGLRNRGVSFGDVAPNPVKPTEDLILEERIKRELHPLDSYGLLLEDAVGNKAPERENIFRFKWHGLFYLAPNKEAFMARLRIPGGQLRTFQAREIARISSELTTGYLQVTTRANFQMRLIAPKDAPALLGRIQSVGLHSRGAGADNVRNITTNATAGIDRNELIDTLPFCHELAQVILNNREFYDLPRKFNIAFDSGGLTSSLEDTNDIGAKAVKVSKDSGEIQPGIYFRLSAGGATGHKAFANDLGVLVRPEQLTKVLTAMLRVYIANGDRTNRKRARLKHLLEQWSLEKLRDETEKLLGFQLLRAPVKLEEAPLPAAAPHSHVGVFAQKQAGLNYVGVALPVGQITSKQLLRLSDLADNYGSGELRLTVWQNIVIPNVPDAYVETVKKAIIKMGLDWRQSNIRSGLVACTGNSYCKFASANTKKHAVEIADYLEKRVALDQPINIHLTGCPNSCAQHYIGDIGLLAAQVKVAGETKEGYHVFVGGGFGERRAIGRQIFHGISVEQLKPTLETMLRAFLANRSEGETFQEFTGRHELGSLQSLFSS